MSNWTVDDSRFGDGRSYVSDGLRFPSVTTIIGIIDKPGLMHWASRLVAEEAVNRVDEIVAGTLGVDELRKTATRTRNGMAATGTAAHSYAESLLADGNARHVDELSVPERKVGELIAEHDIRVVHQEVLCVSYRHEYAGRADLFATVDGRHAIVDWKSSSSVGAEMKLQLAAYAKADVIITSDGVEHPVPRVDVGLIGHISRDPDVPACMVDMEIADSDFEAFLAARRLWGWKSTTS